MGSSDPSDHTFSHPHSLVVSAAGVGTLGLAREKDEICFLLPENADVIFYDRGVWRGLRDALRRRGENSDGRRRQGRGVFTTQDGHGMNCIRRGDVQPCRQRL
ncbi:hypothetical protein DVU_2081 [Nitratidesulfovibrio vulgaris str. Hildenborough]|uniref:Uncharacterized protein n=1 Tax=Nitratidesulfovibrio vulgaris (strain ATCC 29579 / DSM 644 / CCUG 34227 / NCIMB 8303 / VKM B-1760 / Hildenborough) TaxID=882 RepID=Q72AB6_NITV2|nr:hypothetical protein DVU_2081 [Nitratidesulfovibrio vulgaris str. Hildenborough]